MFELQYIMNLNTLYSKLILIDLYCILCIDFKLYSTNIDSYGNLKKNKYVISINFNDGKIEIKDK